MATDAARALAERVEVLERALQIRRAEEGQGEHPIALHPDSGNDGVPGGGRGKPDGTVEDRKGSDKDVEDELRLQLRIVEADRDKAQRIVRDMRAYLLDESSTLQHG